MSLQTFETTLIKCESCKAPVRETMLVKWFLLALSWNGQYFYHQRRWRRSVMYASTFGLLWLLWLIFNLSGGIIFTLYFHSATTTLNSLCYLLCIFYISTLLPYTWTPYIMTLAYWIMGITFIPINPQNSWIKHIIVLVTSYMTLQAYNSRLYFILVLLSIFRRTFSRPSMYDLCLMIFTIPFYLGVCVLTAYWITLLVPTSIAPLLLAPATRFPDQFSQTTALCVMSSTTIGALWLATNIALSNQLNFNTQ